MSTLAQAVSCLDGYDPDALRVDKAREAIRACLRPVAEIERLPVREALGRVLAEGDRARDQRTRTRQLGDGRLRGARRDLSASQAVS